MMSAPPWAKTFSLHESVYVFSANVIEAKLDFYDNNEINALDPSGRTPLQCAISRGFEPIVQLLIEKGAKIDGKDSRGDTPLHYAVLGDDVNSFTILQLLIDKGIDINITGHLEQTALHVAVSRNFESCTKFMLAKGAKVNVQDSMGRTPLHYAVLEKNENILRMLGEHDLHVDLKDENGQTALHLAAKINYKTGVRLLLEMGSNVNVKDNIGCTPLHYSVLPDKKKLDDHKSFVNIFLVNHSYLDEKNEDGQTPLHLAVIGGYFPEVELLLYSGAEVNVSDIFGYTPLHYASMVKQMKLKTFETLLKSGADVKIKDDSERTSLHWTADCNFVSRGLLLIKYGANVNARDNNLNTPLHLCMTKSSTEFVALLLDNGSEVDPMNRNSYTPLQIAIERDLKSATKLLINKGAQVNVKDEYGRSPLHISVLCLNVKIVEELLQNNVDINCIDNYGQSALHVAANAFRTSARCKSIINLLLLKGSNVILNDNTGKSPLDIALLNGHRSFGIVKLLIEWGGLYASSFATFDETLKILPLTSCWTLMELIREYVIKLKCACWLSHAPHDFENYVNDPNYESKQYYSELERIKKVKLECHYLSDVFFKYNDLAFLSNSSIKRTLLSTNSNLEREFPCYATILRATYLKAKERLRLIPVVSKTLGLPLPKEIMWKILSYISDGDIKNVVEAGKIETLE